MVAVAPEVVVVVVVAEAVILLLLLLLLLQAVPVSTKSPIPFFRQKLLAVTSGLLAGW